MVAACNGSQGPCHGLVGDPDGSKIRSAGCQRLEARVTPSPWAELYADCAAMSLDTLLEGAAAALSDSDNSDMAMPEA